MHWLIHNKFDHDQRVLNLINNLELLGVGYTRASVIPFSTEGIQFEDETITIESLQQQRIFTYGSYTMANIAATLFEPGAFVSPFISMLHLNEHYGKEMLNHDMVVGKIKDMDPDMEEFFVRPVEDTKSIAGTLFSKSDYREWKDRIMTLHQQHPDTYATVKPDTLICIASNKTIEAEFRCFVVNGKVATASQYRKYHEPHFSSYVPEYIIDYTHNIIKSWQPDKAFVLDIALCNNKPFVIEANCINSSGLYEIDSQKLIMAVNEL